MRWRRYRSTGALFLPDKTNHDAHPPAVVTNELIDRLREEVGE